ncbi:MAG: carbonate dehydratase [Myxococcaceae bacterium]|nr:carbonate dehydratase [Myxococcaceae bacterium]
MKTSDLILLNNKSWAQERRALDPDFFTRLAKEQKPKFLWIGCSDSRVPESTITSTEPGEIFVHRNIANVCVPTDLNMLSVVQYAVEVLEVEHVIVCGHYGCGGVLAAMGKQYMGPISHWLRHIKDVYAKHHEEIERLPRDQQAARLVEWNCREQAQSLAKSSIIQQAWNKRKGPWVHAWVYALKDGLVKELESISPETQIDPVYKLDF